MRKIALLCALALMVSASTVFALPVVNGDFENGENGWTRWAAPWGGPNNWDASAGVGHLDTGAGSFGWYQRVPVIPSEIYTLVGEWQGDVSAPGWAEIGVIVSTEGMSDSEVVGVIDGPAGSHVLAKKDGWGLNPPAAWDWDSIANAPYEDSNMEVHMTCAEAVVFLKLGSNPGNVWVEFDNIELVPEPAAVLLLGLPMLLIRRRR